MNDEFLTKIHKVPRTEFANALYERISQQPQSRFPWAMTQKLTFRNSVIVFALLFLVAACVYAVANRGWRKVGGYWVQVEETHKALLGPSIPVPSEELETQPQDMGCVSVDEAKGTLRFPLEVPTWGPEGFTFDGTVCGVHKLSDFAVLYWKTGAEEFSVIQLMAGNRRGYSIGTQKYTVAEPVIGPVAPGSYEEVQVHGRSAILVRGDWDYVAKNFEITGQSIQAIDSKWDSELAVQLHWIDGDVVYHLYTFADVSAEDLIKMAESAR